MNPRFNHTKAYPEAFQTMLKNEEFAQKSGIEPKLYELIKIRVSQINGCAFCLDMHTSDTRKAGEEEKRIYLLNAWREASFYSDKEKAALELAEEVTLISKNGVSDACYEKVRKHFDEREFVSLIFLINTINSWNRIAVSTGMGV
ncbi:hypothetical protein LPTSP3_g09350 [Leptospira kobayashii]|uniref:Carboxymuconolactone decarboxylase-like domain-containing protein n=1 Tax=Leptospira kobayashii TaxID=1917830 RepID=A0ABN6KAN1_9LEPT|nr:carboxymuconolactone decarboxylase family protein [Leptospira kobayashii]BDA78005.1 hypothetical protein LPTSP3_g09350 [Leptospira kobayashii]